MAAIKAICAVGWVLAILLGVKACSCPKLDLDPRGPRVKLGKHGQAYQWYGTGTGWQPVGEP